RDPLPRQPKALLGARGPAGPAIRPTARVHRRPDPRDTREPRGQRQPAPAVLLAHRPLPGLPRVRHAQDGTQALRQAWPPGVQGQGPQRHRAHVGSRLVSLASVLKDMRTALKTATSAPIELRDELPVVAGAYVPPAAARHVLIDLVATDPHTGLGSAGSIYEGIDVQIGAWSNKGITDALDLAEK